MFCSPNIYGVISPLDMNVGQLLSARPPEVLQTESIKGHVVCVYKTELIIESHSLDKRVLYVPVSEYDFNCRQTLYCF